MHWTPRSVLPGLSFAVLAATLAIPSGFATESRYSYHYFKEQRPLKLDVTRLAIWRAPAAEHLSRYGLDASAVAPVGMDGWSFIETTASVRTEAGIEQTVSRIAEAEAVEFVSPVFLDDLDEPVVITPTVLVGFDRSLEPSRAEAIVAKSGVGAIVDRDWASMERTYRVASAARNGFTVLEAANSLARRPEVVFAEPDMLVTGHTDAIPNDTYFPYLHGLHNDGTFPIYCGAKPDFDMDAHEAWDTTSGDPLILVAILDTGAQMNHPDLNIFSPGFDGTGQGGGGSPVNVCDNHGTWVAGTVSGIINNSLGIVGISPGVRTASARVFVTNVTTPCTQAGFIPETAVVAALDWAENVGARITNTSWSRNLMSSAIDQKFLDTRSRGMVHFAATGNAGTSTIVYPASIPSVNAVTAVDMCGHRAPFSNYGTGLDFAAPGIVVSTDRTGTDGGNDGVNDGVCLPSATLGCSSTANCPVGDACYLVSTDYAWVAGTSFAAPYAAGIAALLLSIHPNLTADQIEYALRKSSIDPVDQDAIGYDTDFGWGFVNAFNVLQPGSLVTPGESVELSVTSYSPGTGSLSLTYAPACASTSHDIYYGPLAEVSTYGWSGATCGIGNSGEYAAFNPGPGSFFFVVVGNAYGAEGSYGTRSASGQRPAAVGSYCGRKQLLAGACP
jgi:subtilisin family serine protease